MDKHTIFRRREDGRFRGRWDVKNAEETGDRWVRVGEEEGNRTDGERGDINEEEVSRIYDQARNPVNERALRVLESSTRHGECSFFFGLALYSATPMWLNDRALLASQYAGPIPMIDR